MTVTKKIADSRRTIVVTLETGNKLKAFSKKNGLKLYEAIDSLVDVANENEDFSKAVIKLTKDRAKEKEVDREIFSQKVGKLPSALQAKLKSLSADDLAALLEKAGL